MANAWFWILELSQIILNEKEDDTWGHKNRKLFWWGKLPMAPKLRHVLVSAAEGKNWSDVEPALPSVRHVLEGGNYFSAAEQCNCSFIAHAEGILLTNPSPIPFNTSKKDEAILAPSNTAKPAVPPHNSQIPMDSTPPLAPYIVQPSPKLRRSGTGFLWFGANHGLLSRAQRRDVEDCGK